MIYYYQITSIYELILIIFFNTFVHIYKLIKNNYINIFYDIITILFHING